MELTWLYFAIGLIASYLIGSVPTAFIFGKWMKGIDIRQHGSGNMGATNAFRVLGRGPGSAVLVLDVIKGVIPVALVGDLLGLDSHLARVLLGVAVVCGHNWTIFLGFKGGKGIATSLGVLIGLTIVIPPMRIVLAACVGSWIVLFFAFGYVSLASIVAAVVLPVSMALTAQSVEMVILGVVFCVFVVVRHRTNIKRLLAGKEPPVNWPFPRRKNSPDIS